MTSKEAGPSNPAWTWDVLTGVALLEGEVMEGTWPVWAHTFLPPVTTSQENLGVMWLHLLGQELG